MATCVKENKGYFDIGASPLESVLKIYPVVQRLAGFLSTPDMLRLSSVSPSLRSSLKHNGAFRVLSTHKDPLALGRVVKSVADMGPTEAFSGFAQFIRRSLITGYIDHSRVVKVVLDGSNVSSAFVMTLVVSTPNVVLLSIKHCEAVQLSMVMRMLDNAPEGLRNLMIWGLPKTNWHYVPLGTAASQTFRWDSIVSIIKRCESMGIDIDVGPCTTKKICRGRTATIKKFKSDPFHPMFDIQVISKDSIMMFERKPIECFSCKKVGSPQACLECMIARKNTFGFCGICKVYFCKDCLELTLPDHCAKCRALCKKCREINTSFCPGCHRVYCVRHGEGTECASCGEHYCPHCKRDSGGPVWDCTCGCGKTICESCRDVTRCIVCQRLVGTCQPSNYYRCSGCIARMARFAETGRVSGGEGSLKDVVEDSEDDYDYGLDEDDDDDEEEE